MLRFDSLHPKSTFLIGEKEIIRLKSKHIVIEHLNRYNFFKILNQLFQNIKTSLVL